MRRAILLSVALFALAGCVTSAPDAPSAAQLKEMVSRAASLTPEQFELLGSGKAPVFVDWASQPFTLVMIVPYKVVTKKPIPVDFKPLAVGGAYAAQTFVNATAPWLGESRKPGPDDYVSVIRPEYITRCTRVVEGDTIRGTVFVRAEGAYEGTVDYVAGVGPKGWRIEELRLPKSGTRVTLTAQGKWVARFPAGVQPQGMQDTGEGPKLEAYLPPDPEPVPGERPDALVIDIRPKGELAVDGKALSHQALAKRLKQLDKTTPIILRADPEVPYKDVIRMLNLCRKARMRYVSFSARKEGK
jgi:biopolymer transport protein ExbD/TolR